MSTETKAAAHTPGPWEVDWERKWIRSTVEESIVATIQKDLHYRGEADANSQLIAAAPEMLEALELAEESLYNGFEPDNQSLLYMTIKGVIQKAKGGQ